MSHKARRVALAASCAAVLLAAPAAVAQDSGIQAYRTTSLPAAPYRPNLIGPVGSPFERWPALNERARAQIAAGNFDRARQMLERPVRRSSDPQSRYLSAVAHAGLGEIEDARRLFADALAVDEHHVGARVGLALTDIKLGRHDEAAAALAVIEARRDLCEGACRDAVALDRGARLISHFLNASRAL